MAIQEYRLLNYFLTPYVVEGMFVDFAIFRLQQKITLYQATNIR
jgi:hypothetical protein